MKKKDFIYNIFTGLFGQLFVVTLGIVIPRIMITSYGSDVNGLLSTLTQIFTYLALLEAGIGQSARIALYKPIADKDNDSVAKAFVSANAFYRKVTLYYGLCVIILSTVLPLIIKSDIDYLTVFLVTFFEGFSGVLSFYFAQTQIILLNADGKGHINNIISLLNRIFAYLAKMILAFLGYGIVLIQFVYFIITIGKVLFYNKYFNKHYSWLDKNLKPDYNILKDKKSYMLTEIAWTVFSSTDMIVLSMFVSTQLSSVYSIYNMIYGHLSMLLSVVGGSILYVLGQAYHENIKKYEIIHDSFNSVFIGTITILLSIAYLLTIPFVKLYTYGVTDVNYIQHELPLMFGLIQLLSWSRYTTGNLTAISGYAKQTSIISVIEAIVNIVLSILLVNHFGIVGVTLATVIALPIKVLWCLYISDLKVLNRSFKKSLGIFGVNYSYFFIIVYFSRNINLNINNYMEFILVGFLLFIIIGPIGILINHLANKDCFNIIKNHLLKHHKE